MTFEQMLLMSVSRQPHVLEKAIANFMFREIIEDAHATYHISQKDIRAMNKEAVDRAHLLIDFLSKESTREAFKVYAYSTNEWDPPRDTDEIKRISETVHSLATSIAKG